MERTPPASGQITADTTGTATTHAHLRPADTPRNHAASRPSGSAGIRVERPFGHRRSMPRTDERVVNGARVPDRGAHTSSAPPRAVEPPQICGAAHPPVILKPGTSRRRPMNRVIQPVTADVGPPAGAGVGGSPTRESERRLLDGLSRQRQAGPEPSSDGTDDWLVGCCLDQQASRIIGFRSNITVARHMAAYQTPERARTMINFAAAGAGPVADSLGRRPASVRRPRSRPRHDRHCADNDPVVVVLAWGTLLHRRGLRGR